MGLKGPIDTNSLEMDVLQTAHASFPESEEALLAIKTLI